MTEENEYILNASYLPSFHVFLWWGIWIIDRYKRHQIFIFLQRKTQCSMFNPSFQLRWKLRSKNILTSLRSVLRTMKSLDSFLKHFSVWKCKYSTNKRDWFSSCSTFHSFSFHFLLSFLYCLSLTCLPSYLFFECRLIFPAFVFPCKKTY